MLPITSPTRVAMKSALTDSLPKDIINIVDSYFAFSDATELLILGPDGKPSDSELNRTTIDSIKLALTSSECDREIIRLIFKNAADNGYTAVLNNLMRDLRLNNQQINLDKVDFSGINLKKVNFDSASLKRAIFASANLGRASFIAADLTNAQGLINAVGQIIVNSQTVLADTGLYYDEGKLHSILGIKPCLIALSEPKKRLNHLGFKFGNTTYLMKFRDTISRSDER